MQSLSAHVAQENLRQIAGTRKVGESPCASGCRCNPVRTHDSPDHACAVKGNDDTQDPAYILKLRPARRRPL